MKPSNLFLVSLICISLFSCNKNDNNDDNPPATSREWFKLKTITGNSLRNGSYYSNYSINIIIDSANNKIVFKEYTTSTSSKDSSVDTYTYNSQYQLELYEQVSSYDRLYISRMQFLRNADGQLTKVLSEYKNGLMATSEGTFKYDKRGDTTFITFLDSARKHPEGYPDAQDFYQVGLLNNRVVSSISYNIKSAYGNSDSSVTKYEYDALENLIRSTYQTGKATPEVYTYQRESQAAKELQKFILQLGGDVAWFSRAKMFDISGYIGDNGEFLMGNVLQSIKKDNVAYSTYTNEFDLNGNLIKTEFPPTITSSSTYSTTEEYLYW